MPCGTMQVDILMTIYLFTCAHHFHADIVSLLAVAVAIVKVTPCICMTSAFIQGLPALALADRHGIYIVCPASPLLYAIAEAKSLADSLGTKIVVPKKKCPHMG